MIFLVISKTGFVDGFIKCWIYRTDLDSEIPVDLVGFFLPDACQDLLPEVFVQLVSSTLPASAAHTDIPHETFTVILYCIARDTKIQFPVWQFLGGVLRC